jgi:hypothetical protein
MPAEDRAWRLLSHRLRGFDRWDSTRLGLERAMTAGVRNAEFDVRFTRDGYPVAFHDPMFRADDGSWQFVDGWDLAKLRTQKAFAELATLEEMCVCFADFRSPGARLHVDVKVGGRAAAIYETIARLGLLPHVVLVSWLPNVLMRFHALSPQTRLCFSYCPLERGWVYDLGSRLAPVLNWVAPALGRGLRNAGPQVFKDSSMVLLYFHDNGDPASGPEGDQGAHHNVCHVVPGVVSGAMLELLRATHGMVCVPRGLATRALRSSYRAEKVELAVFSVSSELSLERVLAGVDPDIVYVNDAEVLRRATMGQAVQGQVRAHAL